jgi:WhiB family redox-sensing transcriptional regulator
VSHYDWMARALCAQTDPALWHAEGSGCYAQARRICARCPVQPQCADHTARLDTDTVGRHGMWAGQTRKQRETARLDAARDAQRTTVLRLLERGGMTPAAIADHIGCSERTVLRIQAAHRKQKEAA